MADYVIVKANVKAITVENKVPVLTRFKAGEAIIAGESVCILASTGKAHLYDETDTLNQNIVGMALNDATEDQPIDIITDGYVDVGDVATAGDVAVGSTTAGGLASWDNLVPTNNVSVLGFFITASILKISVDNLGIEKG